MRAVIAVIACLAALAVGCAQEKQQSVSPGPDASGAKKTQAPAQDEAARIAALAVKVYGKGTKVDKVETWKAISVTAEGFEHGGELRWLLLMPTGESHYNLRVVCLSEGPHDGSERVPTDKIAKLLSLSESAFEGAGDDRRELTEILLPYLLTEAMRQDPEWRDAGYVFTPIGTVREYACDLAPAKEEKPDSIAMDASFFVDRDGMVLHHKVTGLLTISR